MIINLHNIEFHADSTYSRTHNNERQELLTPTLRTGRVKLWGTGLCSLIPSVPRLFSKRPDLGLAEMKRKERDDFMPEDQFEEYQWRNSICAGKELL